MTEFIFNSEMFCIGGGYGTHVTVIRVAYFLDFIDLDRKISPAFHANIHALRCDRAGQPRGGFGCDPHSQPGKSTKIKKTRNEFLDNHKTLES